MKIRKSVLLEALKVLGKVVAQTSPEVVVRSVRFVGDGERLRLMATDGVECVAVSVECEVAEAIDFAVEYRALRERIRSTRGGEVEVTGKSLEWPDLEEVPEEAVSVELPASFGELLALAAPVVDRDGARLILRGVNLSPEGITATNGKELLHLPCPLAIPEEVTLPFPLALLTAKPAAHLWSLRNERLFRLEIGGFLWQGKALSGKFPAWKQVIPSGNALDYSLEFFEPERIIAFLKTVPDHEPLNGIELNVTPRGVTLIPVDTPEMSFETDAEFLGVQPRAVLVLNKYILLRMLQQRYTKFRAHSDGRMPVVAEGGAGCYVAMPIHLSPKSNPQTNQETNKMENIENKVVSAPVQTVTPNHEPGTNPLDELYNTIDTFRNKLKLALDESTLLVRKVKEVQLAQKQKERDFIQAKRAIERIRMAI